MLALCVCACVRVFLLGRHIFDVVDACDVSRGDDYAYYHRAHACMVFISESRGIDEVSWQKFYKQLYDEARSVFTLSALYTQPHTLNGPLTRALNSYSTRTRVSVR